VKRIENIQLKTHTLSVIDNKPRVAYDAIQYLNPSSIAKGLVDHREIDVAAIKHAFETKYVPAAQASQDRMDRGTLAHMMLLQPERVGKEIAIWDGAKRAGAAWDNFAMKSAGKMIFREEDYDTVAEAVKAFQFQPRIRELLTDLKAEIAMFSSEHSFFVKGMVDAVTAEREGACGPQRWMIDLKTTEAGFSKKAIETTIRNFRNREKMAAYRRWYAREEQYPIEQIRCVNVFLFMEPPYAVRIVDIPTESLDWGEARIVAALDKVQRCLDAKSWPMLVASGEALVEMWELDDEDGPAITFGGEAL